MEEISNRTLLIMLVVVLAVGGILTSALRFPGITGFATTDTATVSLTISNVVAVNFTTSGINWGSGSIDPGQGACDIDSGGENGSNNNCTIDSFNTVTGGLVLENAGNRNVTLNISCGKNASTLLGGTNPGYSWNVTQSESGSCEPGFPLGVGNYTSCSTAHTEICNNTQGGYLAADTSDEITFHLRLHIPSDSSSGSLTDTITATVLQDT